MFQFESIRCENNALDMRTMHDCDQCDDSRYGEAEIVLLSNFTSLIHAYLNSFSIPIKHILSSCKMFKYLVFLCWEFHPSCSLQLNYNLEQLIIKSTMADIPDTIMGYISAHGGLTHVILQVRSVTFDGITTLIGNSPNLVKCHIVACDIMHMA